MCRDVYVNLVLLLPTGLRSTTCTTISNGSEGEGFASTASRATGVIISFSIVLCYLQSGTKWTRNNDRSAAVRFDLGTWDEEKMGMEV
jgi:hypothetical protein